MAKNNQLKKTKLTKKVAREQIASALENSLADLQYALGEKKFQRRIKKASKILLTGLAKTETSKYFKPKSMMAAEDPEQKPAERDNMLMKEM